MQEWKVYEFKELVNLSKEKYNPKNETMNLPCIELEHIESETGRLLGYTDSIEQQSIKNKFKANDILYGKLRPYLRKFYFPNFEGVCSSEIWVLQSIEEKIHNKYLYYLIQTNKFNEHANKSSGTKMPRADWNYISEITFPIPPIKEQQKIASILSTWDKAIELKEKLIEQKKKQKKGLMQKLLTGEVRLPGFEGEWKKVRLGKIGKTYNGLSGKKAEDFGEGKPYIPYKAIFDNSKIYINKFEYVRIEENEKQNIVKYGDIFFTTSSETPDEVGMSSVLLEDVNEVYLNSFCFGYRLNNFDTLIPEFAQFLFRSDSFRRSTFKLAQGSTRFNISKNEMMKITVLLPSIEEQKAIAEVLSNADREIKLLKKQVNFLKEQKKGLMQLLLTGKVRVKV